MIRLNIPAGCVLGLLLCASTEAAVDQAAVAEAVKNGDRAAVKALLQKRADVNAPEPDGSTALHWAAYKDDLETVELLLAAGARATATNRFGVVPLALASTNGNAAIIQALIKAGADPKLASAEGETPLMLAARSGRAAAVKVLLANGADVNGKEQWRGQTSLMWAAAEGHTAVVEALLAAGADINVRSNGGMTAYLFAVRESKAGAVRALLAAGAKVDETIIGGPRPRITNIGTRPAAPTGRGPSALMLAVTNRHFDLAKMLLDAGADPNFAPQGWTALHEMSWVRKPGQGSNDPAAEGSGTMDSLEMVRQLVAHGADINATASGRRVETVMTHLNLNGGSPFFFASRTCDVEMMRLLAKLGADPKLRNDDWTSPLMAAAGLGTRSPGEDAGTEEECVEAVKLALELGNDVNAYDSNGNTAMHGATYKQMPAVVKLLAERGAKPEWWDSQNSEGWTPLRLAVGVYRAGNFRFDPATAKAVQELMVAAGLSTELGKGSTVTSAVLQP